MPVNGEAPVPKETVSSVLRTGCTDPAVDSGDTVVVGTGVAGYSAVIAARRHGADDFPLERASRSGVDCEKTAMAASWIGVARPSRISMAWGSASPPRSARHTRPLEQHPVGDVYAFRFAIHENFLAWNVRDEGGFQRVRQSSELRSPQTGGACTGCAHFDACRGGCMAAKFFTGLPLDGPDPECVRGYRGGGVGRGTARRSCPMANSTTRTAARSGASRRCWGCRLSLPRSATSPRSRPEPELTRRVT
jgi:radical SAM protein with 4Fe4S-binding SPASM domain